MIFGIPQVYCAITVFNQYYLLGTSKLLQANLMTLPCNLAAQRLWGECPVTNLAAGNTVISEVYCSITVFN